MTSKADKTSLAQTDRKLDALWKLNQGISYEFQTDDFKPYHKTSYPIPQAILDLDGYGESGNFVDFVEKKYHKSDRTIDISDIIGDTFQEPLEVEAGGTLTFKKQSR